MSVSHDFGRIVREKREERNWTLEYLAELCEMSVKGVEKIELGDSNPKLSTIIRISNVLDIDTGILKMCVYFERRKNTTG